MLLPLLFSYRRLGLPLVAAGALLSGCELLEFSPNDHRSPSDKQDLTAKNLAALAATPLPAGDTLRFVYTGDSQRFYNDAKDLVASVNRQTGVQFMIVAGDISDFGMAREMWWVDDHLRNLKIPYLTVIGNHDQVGNGREAYKAIFGPLNYSFVYGDTKFIMTDTNGREYNFNGKIPDMNWVRPQLQDASVRRHVIISHVPPQDDDFDPAVRDAYAQALREDPRLVFEMNAHRHSFSVGQPFNDGVTYVNSYAFERRKYLIVTVWGDKEFRLKEVSF
ncbi:metallophosphoesterase family protein [Hymenobacter mucosus]|uniref:Calcineurin-like phosphoesterase n=1 Tax=Hymenobacter mucosus TaxID=1411120 RepID=A0A238WUQ9_9BACT|nr:metallophosphoesterase [Hymenobacter mucosus]SNR50347.1 Calcineurin-like phosphoesterase [Hymenobacter mucosus]